MKSLIDVNHKFQEAWAIKLSWVETILIETRFVTLLDIMYVCKLRRRKTFLMISEILQRSK
jgi:hypothetical protein